MMRSLYIKIVYLTLSILLLAFSSCKKNVAGPKGEPGEPGKSGNVKQSHISSFSQPTSAWTESGNGWKSIIYAPEITSDVVAKGEVKVYMQIGTQWWNLPYAVGNIFMQLSFESGLIHLNYFQVHGGPPAKPAPINFRVVVFGPVQ